MTMDLDELKLRLDMVLTDIKYNGSFAFGRGMGSVATVELCKTAAKKISNAIDDIELEGGEFWCS